jgi:lysophospholipase L1-like esterase
VDSIVGQWWFWGALVLVVVVVLLVLFLARLVGLPRPKIVAVQSHPGEKLVVLVGDSITEGLMSANFAHILTQRLHSEGYRFMNAGVAGDTAYNLLQRTRPVIKSHPDAVVIMVGTNDIQAYLRGGYLASISQRMKRLPQAMTLEWYRDTVQQIVLTLKQETSAHIALCSIPILGEDIDARPNQTVRQFNEVVKALTDELRIAYLAVYETMEDALKTQQHGPGQAFEESKSGGLMMGALWGHNIRGRSWDDISSRNGLALTTDTIHFNCRGAALIADLIETTLAGCTKDAVQRRR